MSFGARSGIQGECGTVVIFWPRIRAPHLQREAFYYPGAVSSTLLAPTAC